MLINLRNALMGEKKSPLPSGARWVEYLHCTGTQWIDTGLPIAPNFYLDATISIPSSVPHVLTFMGTTTDNSPYYRFWVVSIQTKKTINCGLINNAISTATMSANQAHTISVKFFDGEQTLTLDGTTIVSASNTSNAAAKAAWLSQGNLLIGKANASIAATNNFIGKTYAAKIYDSSHNPVRDFYPIAIGTTGYLLDLVSGEYLLYGNKGTGDFVIGPDIPSPV